MVPFSDAFFRPVRRLFRRPPQGRPSPASPLEPGRPRHFDAPAGHGAELVLIAVKDCHEAPALTEAGRRLAARLGARWTLLHVETQQSVRAGERARFEMAETLRAAQVLGGGAACLAGDDVAAAVASYGRLHGASHLVAGAPRPAPRLLPRRPGLATRAAARMEGACLLAVTSARQATAARTAPGRAALATGRVWPYAVSLAVVVAASGIAAGLSRLLPDVGLSVVFLTAVLVAATEFGPGPALFTCLLSLICYDYFFISPIYSFAIGSSEGLTAFFTFGCAALIASRFASRLRAQAYAARRRAAEASGLHRLASGLAGAATLAQAAAVIAAAASAETGRPAAVLLAGSQALSDVSRAPADSGFDAQDFAAALQCLDGGPANPQAMPARSSRGWRFRLVRTADRTVGVVGVRDGGRRLPIGKENRLAAIMQQAAIAVDRINLVKDLDQERQRDATDRLHAALLASISHDLRGPLTAVLGSATALDEHWRTLPPAVSADLIATVREEAARLNGYVANLLDMARLEGTAFRARLSATDIADVVGASLHRAAAVLGTRRVVLDIDGDLPLVPLDPVLLDQVLFNLIDNAAKHAGAGTALALSAQCAGGWIRLRLLDEGPGFEPHQIAQVFDKFYHGGTAAGRRGAGLGLSICRGFVEAMHGRITVSNRPDRPGAQVVIEFPVPLDAEKRPVDLYHEE